MPPGFHMGFTMITCVHEIVSSLIVNFIQHCQGWVFSPPQRREFLMLVPSHGEEGITAVHQVTGNHGVRVNDWREWLWGISLTVKSDHKEHLKKYGKYISLISAKRYVNFFVLNFHTRPLIQLNLTSLCFSIVAYTFWVRSLPPWGMLVFFGFFLWLLLLLLAFLFLLLFPFFFPTPYKGNVAINMLFKYTYWRKDLFGSITKYISFLNSRVRRLTESLASYYENTLAQYIF